MGWPEGLDIPDHLVDLFRRKFIFPRRHYAPAFADGFIQCFVVKFAGLQVPGAKQSPGTVTAMAAGTFAFIDLPAHRVRLPGHCADAFRQQQGH